MFQTYAYLEQLLNYYCIQKSHVEPGSLISCGGKELLANVSKNRQKIARRKIIFAEPCVTVNTTIYFRKGVCVPNMTSKHISKHCPRNKNIWQNWCLIICVKKYMFYIWKMQILRNVALSNSLPKRATNATKNITCAHEYLKIIVGLAHEGSLKRGVEILQWNPPLINWCAGIIFCYQLCAFRKCFCFNTHSKYHEISH